MTGARKGSRSMRRSTVRRTACAALLLAASIAPGAARGGESPEGQAEGPSDTGLLTLEECLEKIESGEICDGKTILGILWYQMKYVLKSDAQSSDK